MTFAHTFRAAWALASARFSWTVSQQSLSSLFSVSSFSASAMLLENGSAVFQLILDVSSSRRPCGCFSLYALFSVARCCSQCCFPRAVLATCVLAAVRLLTCEFLFSFSSSALVGNLSICIPTRRSLLVFLSFFDFLLCSLVPLFSLLLLFLLDVSTFRSLSDGWRRAVCRLHEVNRARLRCLSLV